MKVNIINSFKTAFITLVILTGLCFVACKPQLSDDPLEFYDVSGSCVMDSSAGAMPAALSESQKPGNDNARAITFDISKLNKSKIEYYVTAIEEPYDITAQVYTEKCDAEGKYKIKLPKGNYKLVAKGYDVSVTGIHDSSNLILKGELAEPLEVSARAPAKPGAITVAPNLSGSAEGAKGKVRLNFNVEDKEKIGSVKITYKAKTPGNSDSGSKVLNFTSGTAQVLELEITADTYYLTSVFYSSPDAAGEEVYSIRNETMNVFQNLTTDTWTGNGGVLSEGNVLIQNSHIETYVKREYFVGSLGSESNTGTFFDPFATIGQAVNAINETGLKDENWTITVLDNIDTPDYSEAISGFTNLKIQGKTGLERCGEKLIITSGNVTIQDLIFETAINEAETFLAISAGGTLSVTLKNCAFKGNVNGSDYKMQGIRVSGNEGIASPVLNLTNVDFLNCGAELGGAILGVMATVNYNSGTVKNCCSFEEHGGAAVFTQSGKATIGSVRFVNNPLYGIQTSGSNISINANQSLYLKNSPVFSVNKADSSYDESKTYKNDISFITPDNTSKIYLADGISGISATNRINLSVPDGFIKGTAVLLAAAGSTIPATLANFCEVVNPENYFGLELNATRTELKLSELVRYFVSATGSDSNSGVSAGTPFKTIQKAVDEVIEKNRQKKLADSSDSTQFVISLLTDIEADNTTVFTPVVINGSSAGNAFVNIVPASGTQLNLKINSAEGGKIKIDATRETLSTTKSRVMYVSPDVTLTLSDLKICGGYLEDCDNSNDIQGWGGGILFNGSTAVLEKCSISENHGTCGGGIFIANNRVSGSAPANVTLTDCTVGNENFADSGITPTATDCSNFANIDGGGFYILNSICSLVNVRIAGNFCSGNGGGGYCGTKINTFENAIISYNSAVSHGGGLYFPATADADNVNRIISCTITNNYANKEAGVFAVSDQETNRLILGKNDTSPLLIVDNLEAGDKNSNLVLDKNKIQAETSLAGCQIGISSNKTDYPYLFTEGYTDGETASAEIFTSDNSEVAVYYDAESEQLGFKYAASIGGNIDIPLETILTYTVQEVVPGTVNVDLISGDYTVTKGSVIRIVSQILNADNTLTDVETTDWDISALIFGVINVNNIGSCYENPLSAANYIDFDTSTLEPGTYNMTISSKYLGSIYDREISLTINE